MSRKKSVFAAVILAIGSPAIARAPFDIPAVDNSALDATRGGFDSNSFSLSIRQLRVIQDDAARNDFRLAGSVGNVSMDAWWAATGADLIVASASMRTD